MLKIAVQTDTAIRRCVCQAVPWRIVAHSLLQAKAQALADRVRTRRLDPTGTRRSQHRNPAYERDVGDVRTVLPIVITNQLRRRLLEGRCFPQVLAHSCVRRQAGHADMHNTP
jgi:hypothetical protein